MGERTRRAAAAWFRSPQAWISLGAWIVTRAFVLARVGFWSHPDGIDYADVHQYQVWVQQIVDSGALPTYSGMAVPARAAS